MARSNTESINISKIRSQLRVVITFSLPISDDVKDRLKFLYLREAILDKRLPSEPESDKSTIDATIVDAYRENKVDSILDMIDEDVLVYIAWPIIQKKAAEVENVQNLWLRWFFAAAFQLFGFFFLSRYNIESFKAPDIAPGSEFELGHLYGARSKMEQKALKLYQNYVEKTRFNCLVIKIGE